MEGRLGFVQSEMDLKVLILYILRRLPEAASWEELTDTTLLTDSGIGYFDFSECVADLVRTEHIEKSEAGYTVTEKGRQNGEAMESSLSYSVRVRADKAAAALSEVQRRRGMIRATHELRSRGGFTVHLSMSDGVGPILDLQLLTGDEKQTAKIEGNFKKNAEKLYQKMIKLLSEE